MDAIGLSLLAVLAAGAGVLLWQRSRRARLEITRHRVRCPIHGDQADIAVETDPTARSCHQYVGVASCSLLPNAAIGLPERVGYFWDPPCRVCLDPARSTAVYTSEIPCRENCVEVLNMTAVTGTPKPLRATSGTSDAIGLAEQALGHGRMSRLLWYSSL